MFRLIALSLPYVGLTACREQADKTVVQTPTKEISLGTNAQTLPVGVSNSVATKSFARQVWPIVAGTWVNFAYAEKLRKTHSPRLAHKHWDRSGITVILIDPQNQKGDSMVVTLGSANHEGLPTRYVHMRPGKTSNSLATTGQTGAAEETDVSIRYGFLKGDTLLYLDQYDKKTAKILTTAFQKVRSLPKTGITLQTALDHFVNSLDFQGTYKGVDSTGNEFPVRFTNTGQVKGIPGIKTYQVNTDFEGPFHELDAVFFDIYQKNQQQLAFEIHRDTIRLYGVLDDTTLYKRTRGRLRYTLVKQTK